jgi:serine/threonine protein kinase
MSQGAACGPSRSGVSPAAPGEEFPPRGWYSPLTLDVAPQGPREIEPGHRLDRYELLCPIADGGMASVWLARIEGKHGFEKLVAVKTILPKFATDVSFERMLLDESRIASRIEHANVAQILDLGEHHDVLYLVLEWVEGESLSRLARAVKKKNNGLIPHGILLRILADTCGGLHAAHELRGTDGRLLGVIHRDVSPQNILVSNAGVAKLIDFGIAKARDRLVGETSAGVVKGKVRYMAPEQALGKPTDRRADVWAVGSILYRLLTGKAPYEGENDLASLNLLTAGKPPAPLPASVHPSIAAIVARALSHAPVGRFATAADMQAAMEGAMIAAGIPTTTSHVAKFAAEYLAPYTAKRQNAVQLALNAAAERQRMKELLQPMVHPEVSTDVSQVTSMRDPPTLVDIDFDPTKHLERPPPPRLSPPPVSSGPFSPPASARPVPPTFPLPPRLPPLMEPPRRLRSDPASRPISEPPIESLEPSIDLPPFRTPMKASVIAAGGVVTFLVVLVVIALASRPSPKGARTKATAATTATAIPTSTSIPTPTAIPTSTSVESLPVATDEHVPVPSIAATDLPRAQEAPPAPAVARVRPTPPPVTHAAAPSPPAPATTATATGEAKPRSPIRARVDDGF